MRTAALFDDPPVTDHFAAFWTEYPGHRRIEKKKCALKWACRGLDRIAPEIIAYVKAMKRSDQWKRGIVPAAEVFINQSRWEAELPPDIQGPAAGSDGLKAAQEHAAKLAAAKREMTRPPAELRQLSQRLRRVA